MFAEMNYHYPASGFVLVTGGEVYGNDIKKRYNFGI
jgi:hypothetical protein